MPPANNEHIDLHSQKSVAELKEECTKLAANNDRLVNVIAQNNASKQTIIDLQKRLGGLGGRYDFFKVGNDRACVSISSL